MKKKLATWSKVRSYFILFIYYSLKLTISFNLIQVNSFNIS